MIGILYWFDFDKKKHDLEKHTGKKENEYRSCIENTAATHVKKQESAIEHGVFWRSLHEIIGTTQVPGIEADGQGPMGQSWVDAWSRVYGHIPGSMKEIVGQLQSYVIPDSFIIWKVLLPDSCKNGLRRPEKKLRMHISLCNTIDIICNLQHQSLVEAICNLILNILFLILFGITLQFDGQLFCMY